MEIPLADIAVVTGANKGIGLAVTRALLAEGMHVVAGSLSTDNLDPLDGVTAIPVDLAAPEGPALLVQRALDEHGRVDVLANNVGAVRIRLDGFLGTSDEEFEWAMQMNFYAGLRATRACWSQCSTRGQESSSTSPQSTRSFNPTPRQSTTAPQRQPS